MTHFGEVIRGWLGWCPGIQAQNVRLPVAGTGAEHTGDADRESPQPGIMLTSLKTPHWMTATALVILFATIFVGGNPWWPVIVGTVLIVFLLIHFKNLKKTGW